MDIVDATFDETQAELFNIQFEMEELKLFNQKLVYANKLLLGRDWTKAEKISICNRFDRILKIEECHGLYKQILEDIKKEEDIKKWKDAGYLLGLNDEQAKQISPIFDEVSKILSEKYQFNESMRIFSFASVRRIYNIFAGVSISEDVIIGRKFEDEQIQKKAFALLNIEELLKEVYSYHKYFINFGDAYLKHLDYEAELIILFCRNYSLGIYQKIKD